MDDSTKVLLTVFVTPVLGVIAALVTTQYKLNQERQVDRDKDKEHVRLKILNPLLVASEDLLERLSDIRRRRIDAAKSGDMQRWFREAKDRRSGPAGDFAYWANDEGYFAMSTLYITALYFHYAGTIRRDFPFFELAQGGEATLLSHLSAVRRSIGGKFGIWEAMQDSLGAYLVQEARVKNYREFCELVISEAQAVWLNRLLDFYRDIHLKLDDQLSNVEQSLQDQIAFLRRNLAVPAFEYRLSEASIIELGKRQLPPELPRQLASLAMPDFVSEVELVDALVKCIGQDMTDDYKPSILKCAERRLV